MHLANLSLTNYRNFRRLELALPEGLTVLHGDNGQGKSNLLEAIYLLAIARSHRAVSERDLVSWEVAREGGSALVRGQAWGGGEKLDLRLGLECPADGVAGGSAVRKQVRVNGAPRRVSDLVGLLNAVLFSTTDIDLVSGPPQGRRRYLDVLLSQVRGPYLHALQRYQRVVTQRNHLLRSLRERRVGDDELLFWDQALCAEGSVVLEARHQALRYLTPLAQDAYGRLAGVGQHFSLEYEGTVPLEGEVDLEGVKAALGLALERSRERERALAMTVVGPHRDDLRLLGDGTEMARYASRGQARLAALALRLAEARFLEDRRGEAPFLLLDDVLSELDERRRLLVLEEACRHSQTLVTTTHAELGPLPDGIQVHLFHVVGGQVTAQHDERMEGDGNAG